MRELAVFSGKGGTGKTTLVACFASLARTVVAADCDVDAANLALLLPGEDRVRTPFLAGSRAHILPDRCLGCGLCLEHCRFGAILQPTGPDEVWRVDAMACEGCDVCRQVCPHDAIEMHDNLAGHWMLRATANGYLVHAALGVAQDNSGKLVAEVRDQARQLGEQVDADFVLVDGPPGIGCPVHAAMGRIERLLAVTEPTPSGAHDLTRLLDLAHHFGIQATVVINKWDLAPELATQIETSCQERGVPVLGRIPFDKAIPRMLARGHLPLEAPASAETQQAIRDIWQRFSAPG